MSDRYWMKKPCTHCPFRTDVKPFLHPRRAAEIAYSTQNKYSDFACHKTLGHDDEEGDTMVVATSLTCAGFLSMQVGECIEAPDGFTPSELVYGDVYQMIDAYEEAWEGRS